jgi:MFS family permease
VGDWLGRVRTIQVGAAITAIGALLEATSFSLAQLIVARLVSLIDYAFREFS